MAIKFFPAPAPTLPLTLWRVLAVFGLLALTWALLPAIWLGFDTLARLTQTVHYIAPAGTAVPTDALRHVQSWNGAPVADVRCELAPAPVPASAVPGTGQSYTCVASFRPTYRDIQAMPVQAFARSQAHAFWRDRAQQVGASTRVAAFGLTAQPFRWTLELAIALGLALAAGWRGRGEWRQAGQALRDLRVLIVVLFLPAAMVVGEWVGYLPPRPIDLPAERIVGGLVFAPLSEELFFRVMPWFVLARYRSPVLFLAASTAMFVLAHLSQPGSVLGHAVAGLGLAWLWWKYRSFAACALVHAALNMGAVSSLIVRWLQA